MMSNVAAMADHHKQSNNLLAEIQKQAQLVSDMAWSGTITKTGEQHAEVLENLKNQNEKLQQLMKQI